MRRDAPLTQLEIRNCEVFFKFARIEEAASRTKIKPSTTSFLVTCEKWCVASTWTVPWPPKVFGRHCPKCGHAQSKLTIAHS